MSVDTTHSRTRNVSGTGSKFQRSSFTCLSLPRLPPPWSIFLAPDISIVVLPVGLANDPEKIQPPKCRSDPAFSFSAPPPYTKPGNLGWLQLIK